MKGTEVILQRFNTLNASTLEQKLSTENVTLDDIAALGGEGDTVNTKALMYPITGGGFTDSVTIAWRRLDLAKLFMGIPIVIKDATVKQTRDLIPIINTMYGTAIDPTDIVQANLPINANNALIPLRAEEDSPYVTGSITLRLTKA